MTQNRIKTPETKNNNQPLPAPATIRPLIQGETRKALAREIGSPTEWKRLNAFDITRKTASAPGARIIFGESLAGDERFIAGVSQYVAALNVYAFALRYASVGPFKNIILYLLHWGHRRSFPAILTPLSRVIAERKQAQSGQNLSEDEKPFDCIQWAMDQEIPDKKKSPEDIATRLVIVATGAIDTIAGVLTKVLVELACHPECLDEVRAEIRECLAEEDGDWTVKAMGKMGKLESLLQESLRVTAGAIASVDEDDHTVSGLRLVTNSGFRLDDQTILPNNALLAFPSRCILHDADIFPEPDKFDVLRFYKVKESNAKGTEAHSAQRAVRAGWLQFGYGRQSCPGKLYAINLMKTLVGEMLLRYEIRLAGGSDGTRPAIDFDLDPMLPPNRSIYLEFKSIA
ncbi:cytochrome P450 [Aspergillus heterothallicus]